MDLVRGRMGSKDAQMVLMLLCFAGGAWSHTVEPKLSKDHPTILVEKIRRQLMNENYDYMPSHSEELFPSTRAPGAGARATPDGEHAPTDGAIGLDSDINDQFITRANVNESHAISKKDLLYYVDDDRLKHDEEKSDDTTTTAAVDTTTPNVKYKVLKVKQAHPNRRSQQSFRRFIQEEGDEGVAIINLDDAPFPEFRLPPRRRQYMMEQDLGDLDSEMEVAPPSEMDESSADADRMLSDQLDRTTKVT